jgi:Phage capsid family
MVPVSNDLIRRAPFGVEEIVRDDLVQTVARREDLAFLRGDGSNKSPVGFRTLVLPVNLLTIPAKGPNPGDDLDAVVQALAALKLALVSGLSRMLRPHWFMSATLTEYIATRRDSVGGFYYKDEIASGMLSGIPFANSQLIPTNLGAGNGSEIYLVDMADAVIADTMDVQVDASDVAAYYGTDGRVVSSFQRDQSLLRVICEHDFNMRHLQSLAIGITSDWFFTGVPGHGPTPWSTQPLNKTWAQVPAAWPADAVNPNPPPTLYDPMVVSTSAFAPPGGLTDMPGGNQLCAQYHAADATGMTVDFYGQNLMSINFGDATAVGTFGTSGLLTKLYAAPGTYQAVMYTGAGGPGLTWGRVTVNVPRSPYTSGTIRTVEEPQADDAAAAEKAAEGADDTKRTADHGGASGGTRGQTGRAK